MTSSEIVKNKRPILLINFINKISNFLVKHGKRQFIFSNLMNFLFLLKRRSLSPYTYFYNFINTFVPRINLKRIDNKMSKPLYIPFPPQKQESKLLQNNFLLSYLKTTASYTASAVPFKLATLCVNTGQLTNAVKNKEFIYTMLKRNRNRVEEPYKVRLKKNKFKKNVVRKSKQYYL